MPPTRPFYRDAPVRSIPGLWNRGPAPILLGAGILLIYNGASDSLTYGPAWALFDRNDPTKLIARADRPFLLPELEWEKKGVVPNVIFLEGYTGKLAYYGAADHVIGVARLKINHNAP
jgi:predicted GH43/DUF377 family glycosyl hydrolase